MEKNDFEMKWAGCCDDAGLCCFDCCCPCFTLKEGADNIGESGMLYCLATCCGFGCCALAALGDQTAKKQGIPHSMGEACACSFFNMCTCYSCRVVNETRIYKKKVANSSAPAKTSMKR